MGRPGTREHAHRPGGRRRRRPVLSSDEPRFAPSPARDHRAQVAGLDLQTATIGDLQAALTAGRLTAVELAETYLDRIAHDDGRTNSVREVSPTALDHAHTLDNERQAGIVRGPLHGIPVLLKDNIGTADQPTTAGSFALEGLLVHHDAFVTARLRDAGAVVLGKTNLSEFANWVDPSMPNGFSSLGGQVSCAYRFGDPSGSSSGSGVAGSMAFAAGTIGSETSGSILSPSDVNGLVGVKPTRGLVSRAGIVPLAEGFDSAGPMTRTVVDAAALLTAIAGPDPDDPATDAAPSVDYSAALLGATLTGARLGWSPPVRDALEAGPRALYDAALADLTRLGAVLVATDALDAAGELGKTELDLIPEDFKANLDHFLATCAPVPLSGVRSLQDIVRHNAAHPERMPYGQSLLVTSAATAGDRQAAAARALTLRTAQAAVIDAGLARDGLRAYIAPGAAWSNIGASAGYPSVIVPAGIVDGTTPMGLSFLGTAWSEPSLLALAAAYENGTRRRVPPAVVNPDVATG